MRHYVTVCDRAFIPRLKVLHASMVRHCAPFTLNVLPWDDDVTAWAEGPNAGGVVAHPELAEAWMTCKLPGPPRTLHERMWSARGDLTALLLRGGVVDSVCQLDADLYFFSSPEPLFEQVELHQAPMGLMPHYFACAAEGLPGITHESHAELYGVHNSGSVIMRDAEIARRWADMTRAWCYFRAEDGKFADQKFLEELSLIRGASILPPWAFPGPWTSKKFAPSQAAAIGPDEPRHGPSVAGGTLVAWHFSSLRMSPGGEVTQYANPEYALAEETIRVVYEPYVRELRAAMGESK
jgi:hypothetical protein